MNKLYKKMCSTTVLMLLSIFTLFAQQTITGRVADANGSLAAVSVQVVGSSKATQTNTKGVYSIQANNGETLRFSMVGYTTQEVAVSRQTHNITLEQSEGSLDAVVVTALGLKREAKSLGYSVQKVGGDDLTQTNAPSAALGLMGKVSGLNVSMSNGIEGGSQRVVIRGNTSISGNNQPLYVVDGMPIDNNQVSSKDNDINSVSSHQDWGSVLNFINPDDIEDVNVLKGPTAAALYGARGGNGVILINTKKGKMKDGLGIDYNYTLRINDPYRFQKMQNEYGYGGVIGLYSANKGFALDETGTPRYSGVDPWVGSGIDDPRYLSQGLGPWGKNSWEYFSWYGTAASWGPRMEGQSIKWWDGEMRDYSPQPDNVKSFYRTGNTQTHNVSISGANDLGSIRLSYSRQDNKAIIPNSNFHNNTFNLGSSIQVSKKIIAEVTASYINYERKNSPTVGNSDNSWGKFATYGMSRDYKHIERNTYAEADGSKHNFDATNYPMSYPYGGYGNNVFWNLYKNNSYLNRDQLLATAKLSGELTDWLSFMTRASTNFVSDEMEKKNHPIDREGLEGGYGHEVYKTTDRNLEFLLTAHKDNIGGSLFNTSLSVGGSSWASNYRSIQGWNGGPFNVPFLYYLTNINRNGDVSGYLPAEERKQQEINSLFAMANISYNDLLFLELTGRSDWSSTLPKASNPYLYPAASLSYVFSQSLKNKPSWFDYGKLRVAYAGSASGTDPYQTTYVYDAGTFGGQAIRTLPGTLLPLDLLKPQRSQSYEFGTDVSFLDNRLGATLTYYNVRSTSQILDLNVPISSGVTSVRTNTGELGNKGFEFTIRGTAIKTKDFSWDLTLNGAHNQNKLLNLSPGIDEYYLDEMFGRQGVVMKVKVGDNYGTIYGTDYTYKDGQRVVRPIKDESGNTVGTKYVTTAEQVAIGNATPKLTGGLANSLRYKNFSLYALVDFKWGGDIWAGSYSTAMGNGLAPETLKERNGGGLPYTYPDGSQANHGVILDGVFEDGTKNTDVVNYMWKYAGVYAAWSDLDMPRSAAIKENSWIKLRELRLSYQVPEAYIKRTKFIQNLNVSLIGRDLFYIHTTLPDNLNPEAINGIGNAQGIEFGALPGTRSFGFSLSTSF